MEKYYLTCTTRMFNEVRDGHIQPTLTLPSPSPPLSPSASIHYPPTTSNHHPFSRHPNQSTKHPSIHPSVRRNNTIDTVYFLFNSTPSHFTSLHFTSLHCNTMQCNSCFIHSSIHTRIVIVLSIFRFSFSIFFYVIIGIVF